MYVTGHLRAFKVLLSKPEAYASGLAWLQIIQHEDTLWNNFAHVKQFDSKATFEFPYTVFPLQGDKYRIVTEIQYKTKWIEVIGVVTFAEYKAQQLEILVESVKQIK